MNAEEAKRLKQLAEAEKDNTQLLAAEIYATVRSKAPKFREAQLRRKKLIHKIEDMETKQSTIDFVSMRMATAAKDVGRIRSEVNYTRDNLLAIKLLTVSNLSNERLFCPSSMQREVPLVMSLWDDIEETGITTRFVKTDRSYNEEVAYNSSVTAIGYHDYSSTADLAKALLINKTELELVPYDTRCRIQERLTASRGLQSRFTRLVKGYLYYLGLRYNGNGAKAIEVSLETLDLVTTYTPFELGLVCSSDNYSVIHADKADDPHYIGFLKIIGSNFPVYRDQFFVNEEGNRIMRMGKLDIEGEGDRLCIMCDVEPAWTDSGERIFTFDHMLWHSMLVNYARSIGEEESLDLAFACACTLAFHDKLPSISLPAIRCTGELFARSKATKAMPSPVPNSAISDELVIGGFMAACTASLYFKEVMSHDMSARGAGRSARTLMSELLGTIDCREPLYGTIDAASGGAFGDVLRRMDVYDVDVNEPIAQNILDMNPIALWGVTNIESEKVVVGGLMENWTRTMYQDSGKILHRGPTTFGNTLAMLRDINLVVADNREGFVDRRNAVFRDVMAEASKMLTPGEITIVRSGCRVVGECNDSPALRRHKARKYKIVEKQPEFGCLRRQLPNPGKEVDDREMQDDCIVTSSGEESDATATTHGTVHSAPAKLVVTVNTTTSTTDTNYASIAERVRNEKRALAELERLRISIEAENSRIKSLIAEKAVAKEAIAKQGSNSIPITAIPEIAVGKQETALLEKLASKFKNAMTTKTENDASAKTRKEMILTKIGNDDKKKEDDNEDSL